MKHTRPTKPPTPRARAAPRKSAPRPKPALPKKRRQSKTAKPLRPPQRSPAPELAAMPRPELVALVHRQLASASKVLSIKKIIRLAERANFPVWSSESSIEKLASKIRPKFENTNDLYSLHDFFATTQMGRLIVNAERQENSPIDVLIAALLSPSNNQQLDLTGCYYVYHTAFLYEDRFTVRAMRVTRRHTDHVFSFDEYLGSINGHIENDPTVYNHSGVIAFFNNVPQFLSLNTDQGIGLRLIIPNMVEKRRNVADHIFGRMIGMSNHSRSYTRHVLLERSTEPYDAMRQQTRLGEWKDLTEHQQKMFGLLARRRQPEPFSDRGLSSVRPSPLNQPELPPTYKIDPDEEEEDENE